MFLSTGARVAHVAWRLRTRACVSHPEAQILKENTRYNCKPISISHQLRRVLSQHGRWVKAARGESDGGLHIRVSSGPSGAEQPNEMQSPQPRAPAVHGLGPRQLSFEFEGRARRAPGRQKSCLIGEWRTGVSRFHPRYWTAPLGGVEVPCERPSPSHELGMPPLSPVLHSLVVAAWSAWMCHSQAQTHTLPTA